MNSSTQVPDILKEKSNRLFFLKAILLGIQYGESDKSSFHKKTIQSEIDKLENPSLSSSIQSGLHQPQIPQEKTEFTIKKYEDILHILDVRRVNILSQITNLSSTSYSKMLSFQQNQANQQRMNQLKMQFMVTNKEIEKFTLLLQSVKKLNKTPQISSQESILKKNTHSPSSNQRVSFAPLPPQTSSPKNLQQQSMQEYVEEIDPTFEEIYDNPKPQEEENKSSDDFIRELQKTFGSLSSLLMN
jgi:hypothetical protein